VVVQGGCASPRVYTLERAPRISAALIPVSRLHRPSASACFWEMGRKKASRPKVDIHRSKRKSWVDRYKWVLAAAVILVGVVYWHGHYWIGAEPGSGNKPKFTTRKKTEKT